LLLNMLGRCSSGNVRTTACPQHCDEPPFICPTSQDEDCLYLNVFTPAVMDPNKPLPVMLWWSGGNYKLMTSGNVLYEGDYFANFTNIVLITANYRLGALGYLVTDSLNGNYGVMDQVHTMKWIQRVRAVCCLGRFWHGLLTHGFVAASLQNAAAFGGDPGRVTIFGQSAGSGSVAVHMVSPYSQGLFHRWALCDDTGCR
jgi:carboxylesterase type B